MENLFDEFSKSLAEPVFGVPVSRRESLRRLGAVFAGAVLAPLGLATAAWAHGPDLCRAFCKCNTRAQQSQCLAVCRACNSDPSRICGSCGNYTCCSTACCNGFCSDLSDDPNCGACGNDCFLRGETCCGHYCADLDNDEFNCGACGKVCDPSTPICINGTCNGCFWPHTNCDGECVDLASDFNNCGGCGISCAGFDYCGNGMCQSLCPAPCDGGYGG